MHSVRPCRRSSERFPWPSKASSVPHIQYPCCAARRPVESEGNDGDVLGSLPIGCSGLPHKRRVRENAWKHSLLPERLFERFWSRSECRRRHVISHTSYGVLCCGALCPHVPLRCHLPLDFTWQYELDCQQRVTLMIGTIALDSK